MESRVLTVNEGERGLMGMFPNGGVMVKVHSCAYFLKHHQITHAHRVIHDGK